MPNVYGGVFKGHALCVSHIARNEEGLIGGTWAVRFWT